MDAYANARHHDRDIEGIVLQDRNGYMFKCKFHYYNVMKRLRGSLQFAASCAKRGPISYNKFSDARTIYFIKYFESKPLEEWTDIHIIDAIKQYEADEHLLMALEN